MKRNLVNSKEIWENKKKTQSIRHELEPFWRTVGTRKVIRKWARDLRNLNRNAVHWQGTWKLGNKLWCGRNATSEWLKFFWEPEQGTQRKGQRAMWRLRWGKWSCSRGINVDEIQGRTRRDGRALGMLQESSGKHTRAWGKPQNELEGNGELWRKREWIWVNTSGSLGVDRWKGNRGNDRIE